MWLAGDIGLIGDALGLLDAAGQPEGSMFGFVSRVRRTAGRSTGAALRRALLLFLAVGRAGYDWHHAPPGYEDWRPLLRTARCL
jgi:hypothetical protein